MISTKSNKPFNGVIAIAKHGKIQYIKIKGASDKERKISLKRNNQFIIGSISKQITATLILRAFDEGRIKLHEPIKNYLPSLKAKWSDSVTIHQLLTHTHGITSINNELAFKAGTQYSYSQLGYDLLSQILESITQKTFSQLSDELFKKIGMKNTFHPDFKKYNNLAKDILNKIMESYYLKLLLLKIILRLVASFQQ